MKVNLQIFKRQLKRSTQLIAVVMLASLLLKNMAFNMPNNQLIIFCTFIWGHYITSDMNTYLLKGITRKEILKSFAVISVLTILIGVTSYVLVGGLMNYGSGIGILIKICTVFILVSGLALIFGYLLNYYQGIATFLLIVGYLFVFPMISFMLPERFLDNPDSHIMGFVFLGMLGAFCYWVFYKSMLGVDVK